MANTRAPKYTVQITPTVEPDIAGTLAALAEHGGETAATVAREAIYAGLAIAQRNVEERIGKPLPARMLSRHIAEARARGARHIAAKRARDDRAKQAAAEVRGANAQRPRDAILDEAVEV